MDNPPVTKKSSTRSKSNRAERATRERIKAPVEDLVGAQPARREASVGSENGINYDASSLESAPIENASAEKVVLLRVESVKATETADELASGANGKIMGKLRRAFRKAGRTEVAKGRLALFLPRSWRPKFPF